MVYGNHYNYRYHYSYSNKRSGDILDGGNGCVPEKTCGWYWNDKPTNMPSGNNYQLGSENVHKLQVVVTAQVVWVCLVWEPHLLIQLIYQSLI